MTVTPPPHSTDTALRVCENYEKQIQSPPGEVFALLCPIAEYRWIPSWDCRLVFSKSGVNEPGCIFIEQMSGPLLLERPVDALWVTSRHEPESGRVDFVVDCGGHALLRFEVRVAPDGAESARVRWHAEYTALDAVGSSPGAAGVRERLQLVLSTLAGFLAHYCETGTIMS